MYIIRPAVEPRRHLVLVLWSPPSTEGIGRERLITRLNKIITSSVFISKPNAFRSISSASLYLRTVSRFHTSLTCIKHVFTYFYDILNCIEVTVKEL